MLYHFTRDTQEKLERKVRTALLVQESQEQDQAVKMSELIVNRYRLYGSAALFLAVFVAGCAAPPAPSIDAQLAPSDDVGIDSARDDACGRNRRACMYEGAYEQGERRYAEDQARRLNRAELERLRSQR